MDGFIKVNVKEYVDNGIENGDLVPFWAVKYGRVRARRGSVGEIVYTYTDGGILEKENSVEVDSITGKNDWIITKCNIDGEIMIDEYGNKNEWIMSDSSFTEEYALDPALEGVFMSVDRPQLFVQALTNMIIFQNDEEMLVECGGYINITDITDCYAISERDFNDTYKVINIDNPKITLN